MYPLIPIGELLFGVKLHWFADRMGIPGFVDVVPHVTTGDTPQVGGPPGAWNSAQENC
jgi:hypothetical protein